MRGSNAVQSMLHARGTSDVVLTSNQHLAGLRDQVRLAVCASEIGVAMDQAKPIFTRQVSW